MITATDATVRSRSGFAVKLGRLCGQLRINRRAAEMAVSVIERAGYFKRGRG